MGFAFVSAGAKATWAGGTSQQVQLTALAALWSGQVAVRYYTSGGTHLATVTHDAWIIDTSTTPYSLKPGAYIAETKVQSGVPSYCVASVPGGADILRANDLTLAGPGGELTDPGGRTRLDIGTVLRIYASVSLPAGGGSILSDNRIGGVAVLHPIR